MAEKKRRRQKKADAPAHTTAGKAKAESHQHVTRRRRSQQPSTNEGQVPDFAVVGIGASAGGLDAFKQFFSAMPADTGMAFVLIQHLDPTHSSLTAELLRAHTGMNVVEVREEMPVEPNCVYVIPPNRYLSISGKTLHLSEPVERRGVRVPIDFFFRSLADDQQQRAIGIILSGSGSDGTLGVREIKAAGGMVMAQSPETCQFDGMPRSAQATGVVDHVLPIEKMPDVLIGYVRHWYVNGAVLSKGDRSNLPGRPDQPRVGARCFAQIGPVPFCEDESLDDLQSIIGLLRARLKYDFGSYKKGTVTRRVQRRMGLRHIEDMGDYLELLRQNKDEVNALYKDMLISVTNFFREPEAWQALEQEVIAPLVRAHDGNSPIRVWVPGCATGEEAYSIAMLLAEQLQAANDFCPLQVFASDIDQDALTFARAGIYPENIAADVSPERLRQFFIKGEHTFRINKGIRDAVVFAEQNLISDPPFSKLDLVSCRNLMIYLEADLQKKIVSMFHFVLNEGGYLFLGSSETVSQQHDLFEPVSRKQRIYRRIGPTRLSRVELPVATTGAARHGAEVSRDLATEPRRHLHSLAQHLMLQRFAPACVLINRKLEVLFLSGPVDRYLQLPPGELAADLLAMARPGLRTKLRTAIHQAIRDDQSVSLGGLRITRDGKRFAVRLAVEPLHQPREAEGLLLIALDEESDDERSRLEKVERQAHATPDDPESPSEFESFIRQLEDELRITREELRSTIEELETSNEEFKASNEEVVSINEELQSTNEELETSQEELRSLNEELQTVNSQLEHKIDQLETANNDLSNLLASTEIATLCLDRQLRIKWFTPAMTRLVNLRPSDTGRPLANFTKQFTDTDLLPDAERVLQRLTPIEKQIKSDSGLWYLRRISPYRTEDDRIDGVVVTFVDITRQKQDAFDLPSAQEELRLITDSTAVGLKRCSRDMKYRWVNEQYARMLGRPVQEIIGQPMVEVLGQKPFEQLQPYIQQVLSGQKVSFAQKIQYPGVEGRWFRFDYSPTFDGSGEPDSWVGVIADITDRKRAEQAAHEHETLKSAMLDASLDAIISIDHEGMILEWNPAAKTMFGRMRDDVLGKEMAALIIPPGLREQHRAGLARYLATGDGPFLGKSFEFPALRVDGTEFPAEVAIIQIKAEGLPTFAGFVRDITERKWAERALRESEERLRLATEGARIGTWHWDLQTSRAAWSKIESELIGCDPEVPHTAVHEFFDRVHPDDQSELRSAIDRAIERDEPYDHEFRVVLADGQARWLAGKGEVYRDDSGKPVQMMGVNFDIQDRKRAEDALADLNQQLEQLVAEQTANTDRLLDESPDAVVMINHRGEIARVNLLMESVFGYTRSELLGQPIELLLPEERRAQHPALRDSYFADPRVREMGLGLELAARHKNGRDFPVEIQLTPLVINGETVAAASIRDITEQRRSQTTQARLAAIMQNTSTAVWVLDLDSTISHWNLGAERLFGYSAEEIVGLPASRLKPPERISELEEDVRRLVGGQLEVHYDTVCLHKDGTPIDVSITKSLVRQSQGATEILVVARDIQEEMRLERQMAKLTDNERQRLGRELHDSVGQECTAISMLVATLKQHSGGSPQRAEILDRLEHCAESAKQQLRRLNKGLLPVDLDADGLRVALEDLAEEVRQSHNVECRFECPTPIHVQDNRVATQLYLIVREAVHNAVKHAQASRITIRVEEESDALHLAIRDDGVGLPGTTKESTGMGLRIMRYRCGLIGGKITFDAAQDGGTIVAIFLGAGGDKK